ncbi:MAG: 2,3,4,5-tetrahydropyridine-2,6-dicarboxylate N-succinyltransferase, partial [Flavobacteriia bacterium]|nr:2,3,4,5-tetrahydropyridine-2,6-dicarboxylate N-succinyltransferase [Flavobacteriia bacterium]
MTDYSLWKSQIEAAWEDRSLLQQPQTLEAIDGILAAIDAGA